MRILVSSIGAIAASVLGLPTAGATTLPAAQYSGGDDITGYTISTPGTYDYTTRGDAIQVYISGALNAVSDSQNANSLNTYIQSDAQIVYWYEVTGPTNTVPIFVTYTMQATGSGDYQSVAELGTGTISTILCSGSGNGGCSSVAGSIVGSIYSTTAEMYIPANTAVEMHFDGLTTIGPGDAAFASVDPIIEVDPTFPDAGAYTIAFSAGVSNGVPPSPVPEPGSLALLATGLVGFGLFRSRSWRCVRAR